MQRRHFVLSIFFCLAVSTISQAAVINCNSFWRAFPSAFPCEEVTIPGWNGAIGRSTFRFFHYFANWDNAPEKLQVLNVTAQAVREAVPVYQSYGSVPSIYFVLSPTANAGDTNDFVAGAMADPASRARGEPCPVTIFPNALRMSEGQLKQLIAHEMFHCFQGENMPGPTNGVPGVNREEWGKTTGWWAEGTADYFSNLVYPSNNWEHTQQKYYDANKQVHLQGWFYSTSAFFQSIGNDALIGPHGIVGLLKTFPSQGGPDQQRTPLSKDFNLRSAFHEFGKQLILDSIADTGGGSLPTAFTGQPVSINAEKQTHTYSVSATPFIVTTTQFVLQPGFKYTFGNLLSAQLQGGAFASVRRGNSRSWSDLSTEDQPFDLSCDESPYMVELLITRTDDSAQAFNTDVTVTVEGKPCQCKVDERPLDPCFIGNWEFDNAVLPALFEQLQLPIQLISSSGQFLVGIKASHRVDLNFADWYQQCTMQQDSLGMATVENTYNGSAQGLIGVTPQNKACLRILSDASHLSSRITLPEMTPIETVTEGAVTAPGFSSDSQFTIRCTPSRMTWRVEIPASAHRGSLVLEGALNRVR